LESEAFNESEMALISECRQLCANNVLDRADIVRDGDLSPTAISLMMLPDLVTTPYKLDQEFGRQGTSVGNCAYLNSQ